MLWGLHEGQVQPKEIQISKKHGIFVEPSPEFSPDLTGQNRKREYLGVMLILRGIFSQMSFPESEKTKKI